MTKFLLCQGKDVLPLAFFSCFSSLFCPDFKVCALGLFFFVYLMFICSCFGLFIFYLFLAGFIFYLFWLFFVLFYFDFGFVGIVFVWRRLLEPILVCLCMGVVVVGVGVCMA